MNGDKSKTWLFVSLLGCGLATGLALSLLAQFCVVWKPGMGIVFIAGCALLGAAVGGLGIFLAGRSGIRRLRVLEKAMSRVAAGDLSVQLPPAGADDLGKMAKSLNDQVAYLREVASVAQGIASGDLTRSFPVRGPRDEFGSALFPMNQSLRDLASRLRVASSGLDDKTRAILGTGDQLAKSASAQASTTEQTSSSLNQMVTILRALDQSAQLLDSQVRQVGGQSEELAHAVTDTSSSINELAASIQRVAGNVHHAQEASEKATEAANIGETSVAKTIEGMEAISDTMRGIRGTIHTLEQRSGEIGAIIEVIDDIAEQTNLLALNAAIEAARAGEAGRGFAVVADEVRKLAERSAKATREISDLIKGIQKETALAVGATQKGNAKVEEGAQLASDTGSALSQIKAAASQVAALLHEITTATNHQAQASSRIVASAEHMATINRQVTGAIADMGGVADNVTNGTSEQHKGAEQLLLTIQQHGSGSQEAARVASSIIQTAREMAGMAQGLQEAIAFLKVHEGDCLPSPPRPLALPR